MTMFTWNSTSRPLRDPQTARPPVRPGPWGRFLYPRAALEDTGLGHGNSCKSKNSTYMQVLIKFRIGELIPLHSILRLTNRPGCAKEPNSTLDRFGPAVGLLVKSSLNTKSPPRLLADDVHSHNTVLRFCLSFCLSPITVRSQFPIRTRSGDRREGGSVTSEQSQESATHQDNGCSKHSKRQDTGEAGVKGWRSTEPHIGSPAAETRKAE